MIKSNKGYISAKGTTMEIVSDVRTVVYWFIKNVLYPTAKVEDTTLEEELDIFLKPIVELVKEEKKGEENED